jgi:hypothetical protein
MNIFLLATDRFEFYEITENGQICKGPNNVQPSEHWKMLGIIRRNNFGNVVESIGFDRLSKMSPNEINSIKWKYKNGKSRWTLRDFDHGTMREWGNGRNVVLEIL